MSIEFKDRMNGHTALAMDDALEGARRATGDASSIAPPDPEVATTARRRQFSMAERRRILIAADGCKASGEIGALLRREGIYLGSVRTMYRLLAADGVVRERRNQLTHPVYAKPELLATGPNEVWSWDITKIKGPVKWTCFHLYVILDIFSRYVVGWMIALRESSELAEQLIADTVLKQNIAPGTLTLHADRGTSMRSKLVAELLVDLDVAKSHSRSYVSDDNPFSEAHFKTLKYRPDFPERFGCIEDARAHCQQFFNWYNDSHRHSGIGFMTPTAVHHGQAKALFNQRADTLDAAFAANPKRFKGNNPQPPKLPIATWINPPKQEPTLKKTPDPWTLN